MNAVSEASHSTSAVGVNPKPLISNDSSPSYAPDRSETLTIEAGTSLPTTTAIEIDERCDAATDLVEDGSNMVLAEAEVETRIDHEDEEVAIESAHPITTWTGVGRPILRRARLNSTTLIKVNANARVGLHLREAVGHIHVSNVKPSGLLAASPLRVGDELISINGKDCREMASGAAVKLIRQLTGALTIVACNESGDSSLVETMVEKSDPDANVGIGLRRAPDGRLQVSKVRADGLFAHSLVNIGDRVLSINDTNARHLEPVDATELIRNSNQYVTIVCESIESRGIVMAEIGDQSMPQLAAATASASIRSDLVSFVSWRQMFRNHTCFCTWLIILSITFIGTAIKSKLK